MLRGGKKSGEQLRAHKKDWKNCFFVLGVFVSLILTGCSLQKGQCEILIENTVPNSDKVEQGYYPVQSECKSVDDCKKFMIEKGTPKEDMEKLALRCKKSWT